MQSDLVFTLPNSKPSVLTKTALQYLHFLVLNEYLVTSIFCYRGLDTISTPNPLPDNKILDWSKLIQIADDILNCI